MDYKILTFECHGDQRGQLIALEELKSIPFEIKRVYYMFDTASDAIRGKHAHKSLEQVLICTSGSCKILLDDGNSKTVINLDDPKKGLYISNNLWREMFDFSDDAVLMVLASDYYKEEDYIRNYEEFVKSVKRHESTIC